MYEYTDIALKKRNSWLVIDVVYTVLVKIVLIMDWLTGMSVLG